MDESVKRKMKYPVQTLKKKRGNTDDGKTVGRKKTFRTEQISEAAVTSTDVKSAAAAAAAAEDHEGLKSPSSDHAAAAAAADQRRRRWPADAASVKKRLREENEFASKIVNAVHIQQHGRRHGEDEDEVEYTYDEEKHKVLQPELSARASSREELLDKIAKLKGTTSKVDSSKKPKKLSKIERKQKARKEKKLRQKLQKQAKNPTLLKPAITKPSSVKPTKPIFNSEGKMVFSKFDFSADVASSALDGGKKQNLDPKSALKKLESQKEKMKSLQEKGKTEKAKRIEEKASWSTALEKSEGVKVKDDPQLLKKSIKKMEQKKKSSKKKWEARNEAEDKRKSGQQQKRTDNLQKRRTDNKKSKMKKAAKKGRHVPGFG